MKVKDIEIGGVYSNSKSKTRKVINISTGTSLYYRGCSLTKYEIQNGKTEIILTETFARWAKEKL